MRARLLSLLLVMASAWVASVARAEIEWTFEPAYLVPEWPTRASVGFAVDFNRGDFGSGEDSDTLSLQPTIRLDSDNVILRASLPFYRLEGQIDTGLDATRESKWGVGDLNFDLGYTIYPVFRGGPFIDLLTRFKAPTAKDEFGTEEFDFTVLVSLYQPLPSDFAVIGDFGKRLRGGAFYRDTYQAALLVGHQAPGKLGIWLAYDWRETPVPSVRDDEHELTPFVSMPFGERLRVDLYTVRGLNDDSTDWGLGAAIWWRL